MIGTATREGIDVPRLGMRRAARSSGRAAAAPGAGPGAGPAAQTGSAYRMRERLLAFGDDFFIETGAGRRAFWVDGKALRVRDTLHFKDMQGNEIYRIQEKMMRIRDSMTIYRGNDVAAKVHKALITPLRDRYAIDIPGSPGMSTKGNILQHEYHIESNGMPVATISKRWFRIRDTYGVEIAPGQDDLLILAVTVCIDAMSQVG
jgi:uncharacterized protein YxjI